MANEIKLKRGSGSDPSASDLVVGEIAIRTDTGKLFTKKDDNSVAEISGGGITDGDKGDITVSNSGATFTIDNDAVTYAKIQNVSATDRLLGRDSSGAGIIEEIAPGAVRTMLGLASSATTDTTNASNISSGTLAAARVATLNQDTTGNAATATALETARTIAGVSFDGTANISLNNNAITNGAGYITDLVSDTSPQLGGDLDTNDHHIVLDQDHYLYFITNGGSAFLGKTASGLFLQNNGDLFLRGDDVYIRGDNNENCAVFKENGAAELYYDNSKKLETASGGVSVTGNIVVSGTVDGRDLATDGTKLDGIASGATNVSNTNQLTNGAGFLTSVGTSNIDDDAVTFAKLENIAENHIVGRVSSGTGIAQELNATEVRSLLNVANGATNVTNTNQLTNGAGYITDLVNDTSPQLGGDLSTNGNNITSADSTGGGNNRIVLGSGADLNLYSDGTNVRYEGNNLHFKNANGDEFLAKMINGGAVELYHNNSKKAETVSGGFTVTGTCTATAFSGDGSALTGISAGATGGGSDEVFYENDQTVTTNYTITNGKNAMAAGPITINSGVTVTVGSGETLTIV